MRVQSPRPFYAIHHFLNLLHINPYIILLFVQVVQCLLLECNNSIVFVLVTNAIDTIETLVIIPQDS